MKPFLLITMIFAVAFAASAQTSQPNFDTTINGQNTTIEDSRVSDLEKKLLEHNEAIATAKANAAKNTGGGSSSSTEKEIIKTNVSGIVLGRGYRLMIIKSNDMDLVKRVRSKLLTNFPEHKPYMSFQMPNTILKMGNFIDRGQADKVRKRIAAMKIVDGNIFILPEQIEIKVNKTVTKEVEVTADDKKKKEKEKKEKEKKKETKKGKKDERNSIS
jgi:hypothetical protein